MKIPIYVSIAASGLNITLGAVLFDQIEVQRQKRELLEQELREVNSRLLPVSYPSLSFAGRTQSLIRDLLVLSETDDNAKRIVSKYKLEEEGQPPSPAQIPQGPPRI